MSARLYFFLAPEGLLDGGLEDLAGERVLPAEDRLPADDRVLLPDDRDLPAALDRGADVRPGLLRTELGERPLGATADDRLLPEDVGARPYRAEPVRGTTTGRVTDDRPATDLGATSWRPPAVEPDGVEVVGEEPYVSGR